MDFTCKLDFGDMAAMAVLAILRHYCKNMQYVIEVGGIRIFSSKMIPYKNEKVAARLQLGCCYYAAIKYVCSNWWRQSSQLERQVACLLQPCSFYQRLQAHRATTRNQLQLAAVTIKKTARTHSL